MTQSNFQCENAECFHTSGEKFHCVSCDSDYCCWCVVDVEATCDGKCIHHTGWVDPDKVEIHDGNCTCCSLVKDTRPWCGRGTLYICKPCLCLKDPDEVTDGDVLEYCFKQMTKTKDEVVEELHREKKRVRLLDTI